LISTKKIILNVDEVRGDAPDGPPQCLDQKAAGGGDARCHTHHLQKKPEEREVAFDADLMMMATYHKGNNGVNPVHLF